MQRAARCSRAVVSQPVQIKQPPGPLASCGLARSHPGAAAASRAAAAGMPAAGLADPAAGWPQPGSALPGHRGRQRSRLAAVSQLVAVEVQQLQQALAAQQQRLQQPPPLQQQQAHRARSVQPAPAHAQPQPQSGARQPPAAQQKQRQQQQPQQRQKPQQQQQQRQRQRQRQQSVKKQRQKHKRPDHAAGGAAQRPQQPDGARAPVRFGPVAKREGLRHATAIAALLARGKRVLLAGGSGMQLVRGVAALASARSLLLSTDSSTGLVFQPSLPAAAAALPPPQQQRRQRQQPLQQEQRQRQEQAQQQQAQQQPEQQQQQQQARGPGAQAGDDCGVALFVAALPEAQLRRFDQAPLIAARGGAVGRLGAAAFARLCERGFTSIRAAGPDAARLALLAAADARRKLLGCGLDLAVVPAADYVDAESLAGPEAPPQVMDYYEAHQQALIDAFGTAADEPRQLVRLTVLHLVRCEPAAPWRLLPRPAPAEQLPWARQQAQPQARQQAQVQQLPQHQAPQPPQEQHVAQQAAQQQAQQVEQHAAQQLQQQVQQASAQQVPVLQQQTEQQQAEQQQAQQDIDLLLRPAGLSVAHARERPSAGPPRSWADTGAGGLAAALSAAGSSDSGSSDSGSSDSGSSDSCSSDSGSGSDSTSSDCSSDSSEQAAEQPAGFPLHSLAGGADAHADGSPELELLQLGAPVLPGSSSHTGGSHHGIVAVRQPSGAALLLRPEKAGGRKSSRQLITAAQPARDAAGGV